MNFPGMGGGGGGAGVGASGAAGGMNEQEQAIVKHVSVWSVAVASSLTSLGKKRGEDLR
jgi:hypothetical protein